MGYDVVMPPEVAGIIEPDGGGMRKPVAVKTPKKPPRLRLQEDRVSELLDVALQEFLARGVEAASLSEIARRAGASKTTFYKRFPTKEKLFVAVLERRMDEVFNKMAITLPSEPPLAATLIAYGIQLSTQLSSQHHLALYRLISMEAPRFPELNGRYYELGAARSQTVLTAYFEEQVKRKRVAKVDPALLAENYLNALFGSLRFIVRGLSRGPVIEDATAKVEGAVEFFLRAYALKTH